MRDSRSALLLAAICLFVFLWKAYNSDEIAIGALSKSNFVEIAESDEFPVVYRFADSSELESISGLSSVPANIENGIRIIKDAGDIQLSRISGLKCLALGIPIGINSASAEDLEALPGIGNTLAGRIVEYRALNKRFKTINELAKVNGIGEKKLEAIKPFVNLD